MQSDVTLSDIAQKLGVSSVTVSKALAGKKGVSDELREEIINLAQQFNHNIENSDLDMSEGKRAIIQKRIP